MPAAGIGLIERDGLSMHPSKLHTFHVHNPAVASVSKTASAAKARAQVQAVADKAVSFVDMSGTSGPQKKMARKEASQAATAAAASASAVSPSISPNAPTASVTTPISTAPVHSVSPTAVAAAEREREKETVAVSPSRPASPISGDVEDEATAHVSSPEEFHTQTALVVWFRLPKRFRFRDARRVMMDRCSPSQREYIETHHPHSEVITKLPHRLTARHFAACCTLLAFHYAAMSGEVPQFWLAMDRDKLMQCVPSEIYGAFRPEIGQVVSQLRRSLGDATSAEFGRCVDEARRVFFEKKHDGSMDMKSPASDAASSPTRIASSSPVPADQ
jgi:hypothetical protein